MATRLVVSDLEGILGQRFDVLDHGFVRVIDYMGGDESVVQAARVSYGVGTKAVREDEKLIRYLMKHRHTTPFEMCEIKLHIKLPIFVARQWIRHRTANVNEQSARYSEMQDVYFSNASAGIQSSDNKQGRATCSEEVEQAVQETIKEVSEFAYKKYTYLIEKNVSREIARVVLGVNYYTEWYWKTDLHNLLNFLRLRNDSRAQHEIREYAAVIEDIVKAWVPHVYGAYKDFVKDSYSLSATGIKAIKSALKGNDLDAEGLSERERKELKDIFEVKV